MRLPSGDQAGARALRAARAPASRPGAVRVQRVDLELAARLVASGKTAAILRPLGDHAGSMPPTVESLQARAVGPDRVEAGAGPGVVLHPLERRSASRSATSRGRAAPTSAWVPGDVPRRRRRRRDRVEVEGPAGVRAVQRNDDPSSRSATRRARRRPTVPCVSCRCPPAVREHRPEACTQSPFRETRMNAIRVWSGDHAGCMSLNAPLETGVDGNPIRGDLAGSGRSRPACRCTSGAAGQARPWT